MHPVCQTLEPRYGEVMVKVTAGEEQRASRAWGLDFTLKLQVFIKCLLWVGYGLDTGDTRMNTT